MEEELQNTENNNTENLQKIDNCLKKIEKIEKQYKKSKKTNSEKNIEILKKKEIDLSEKELNLENDSNLEKEINFKNELDLEKKIIPLINFYENLVKNQENFYEDCLDSIELLEKEEYILKKKTLEIEKRIMEENTKLKKGKNSKTKEYLNLVDKIDEMKNLTCNKKIFYEREKSQILKIEKDIEKNKKEFSRLNTSFEKNSKTLEKISQNFESKKKGLTSLQKNLIYEKEKNTYYDNEIKKINEKMRYLNNEIQNLKGNIRVYLRIKPLSKNEKSTLVILENNKLELKIPKKKIRSENYKKIYSYNFEHIFDHKSTQEEIFEELNDLMLSVYDGFNVCIFAYGPTGTGKTFTMMGDSTHEFRGLAPRVLEKIFDLIEKGEIENNIESFAELELLEIYQDEVKSLLPNFAIRKKISTVLEAFHFLESAINKRVVKKTMCNSESSRSHLIFKLIITTKNKLTDKTRTGTLVLVDLAGSERVDFSKTTGQGFKETLAINKSLTSLKDVISALYKKVK